MESGIEESGVVVQLGARAAALLHRGWARLASLSPRAVLTIGWALFLVYAFPGYMSSDSVFQLHEARTGHYTSGHPPTMAFLWRIVELVVAGPVGMLVLQSLAMLLGTWAILRRVMRPQAAAWAAVLLLLFPPNMVVMAVIWKDSQMAAYLVLAVGLLLSPRRWVRVAGLVVMMVASAMRHNAPAATLPLVVLLFEWSPGRRFWARHAIALAAWLAVTAGSVTMNRALAERSVVLWDGVALADIAGALRYWDDLPDEELGQLLVGVPVRSHTNLHARMKAVYDPFEYAPLFNGDDRIFDRATTQEQRDSIQRAWRRIVRARPTSLLQHRAAMGREILRVDGQEPGGTAYVWFTNVLEPGPSVSVVSHLAAPSRIQDRLRAEMTDLGASVVFRPYLYLLLSLALLVLARQRACSALLLGGLSYELALLFITPTPDYRYSHWMIICACIVAVYAFADRWQRGRARDLGARVLASPPHERPTTAS